jgi:hypothetical protein
LILLLLRDDVVVHGEVSDALVLLLILLD